MSTAYTGYSEIYNHTRFMIMALSGMTEESLDLAAVELQTEYEVFVSDYGCDAVDNFIGFELMNLHWDFPSSTVENDDLNGLSPLQTFFAWAWNQNELAKYFLGGQAVVGEWKSEDAMKYGVVAAVSAAKSLFHAKSLLASGEDMLGRAAAPRC